MVTVLCKCLLVDLKSIVYSILVNSYYIILSKFVMVYSIILCYLNASIHCSDEMSEISYLALFEYYMH